MTSLTAEQQLAAFIDKFSPEVAALIRALRKKMRTRLPTAMELVYDNYNFMVIGYGPSDKAREAIFSLAAQAKGVSLCFLQGAKLPDPAGLLRGSGNLVRSLRLDTPRTLELPGVRTLIETALLHAKTPLPPEGRHVLLIKSVSAKQRPKRTGAQRPTAAAKMHGDSTAARQLGGFLDKYEPNVAKVARDALAALRKRLPGSYQLVYDNYNALAIAFSPRATSAQAIFSIAVYPRWVSLFFAQGARLPDPHNILKGSGNKMRHIVLTAGKDMEKPGVEQLIALALRMAEPTIEPGQPGQLLIKAIAAKQRERRVVPSPGAARQTRKKK